MPQPAPLKARYMHACLARAFALARAHKKGGCNKQRCFEARLLHRRILVVVCPGISLSLAAVWCNGALPNERPSNSERGRSHTERGSTALTEAQFTKGGSIRTERGSPTLSKAQYTEKGAYLLPAGPVSQVPCAAVRLVVRDGMTSRARRRHHVEGVSARYKA
eukprot:356846-Chlamydomonas_euryale.AAC.2